MCLGFVMEWVKIEVNWLLKISQQIEGFFELTFRERVDIISKIPKSGFYDYYSNHSHIDVLNYLSQSQLVMLKWFLTVVFCLLFFLLCNAILKTAQVRYTRELRLLYAVSFTVALLVFCLGKILKMNFYPFSRLIIGFLQSLIPAVVLVLVSIINGKNE